MKNFKSLFVVLSIMSLASFSFVASSKEAYACSCLPVGSVEESLDSSSAVFAGTVLSIEGSPEEFVRKVTFSIDKSWKGVSGSNVAVTTALDSAGCGFEFTVGGKYLVYADGDATLNASLCSRTHELAENDPDVAELDRGEASPNEEGGREEDSSSTKTPLLILGALVLIGIIYKVASPGKAS